MGAFRSYFGILLDDNNRKPLARLHFQSKTKKLGLFDNSEKREDRVVVQKLDDIYSHRARLLATLDFYETNLVAQESETYDDEIDVERDARNERDF